MNSNVRTVPVFLLDGSAMGFTTAPARDQQLTRKVAPDAPSMNSGILNCLTQGSERLVVVAF